MLIHPLELPTDDDDDEMFDSPSDNNSSMISLASLDQGKYHWYPNPKMDA